MRASSKMRPERRKHAQHHTNSASAPRGSGCHRDTPAAKHSTQELPGRTVIVGIDLARRRFPRPEAQGFRLRA